MPQPLFAGLVVDENDQVVETAMVGSEPMYVVNDAGFRRHIPAEYVDRQVLNFLKQQISGHEDLLSEQTAKMLGQEDIFSKAIIEKQFRNIDQQFEQLLKTGIPEEGRAYMGMMGFRIVINFHGDVIRIDQPGLITGEDEGE
jgi:acetylglutamate synthase